MKKKYYLIAFTLLFVTINAQVGIGNENPRGLLDVNDNLNQSTMGLVVPTSSDVTTFVDPSNSNAVSTQIGTIGYDTTLNCLRVIENSGDWSNCLGSGGTSASVSIDCNSFTSSGSYIQTVPFNSSNTFSYNVSNNSFTTVTIDFNNALTVTSSVGDAITATATEDYSAVNLTSGQTKTLTYELSGTPSNISTLTINFNKISLECSNTIEVLAGGAVFTNPVVRQDVSFDDISVNNNDIQGQFTGPFTVDLPYTIGQGAYDAFNTTFTAKDQNGVNQTFTIDYPAGTFSSSGAITATITPSVNPFLIPKQQAGIFTIYGTVDTPYTKVNLEAIGGVPDRNFGDGSHDFVYIPVEAADGNIWLNNDLGCGYCDKNNPDFDPTKQANAYDDFNAYGSLFQWGRLADGHELIKYTSSTSATAVNGITSTLSTTDVPGNNLYIFNSGFTAVGDWRSSLNNNLWQGEQGINNPCPKGYRVPTTNELLNVISAEGITDAASAVNSTLGFSLAGRRTNGAVGYQGVASYHWTTETSGNRAGNYQRNVSRGSVGVINRNFGFSVRCIKD